MLELIMAASKDLSERAWREAWRAAGRGDVGSHGRAAFDKWWPAREAALKADHEQAIRILDGDFDA
jgi:hypothetical protein